MDQRERSLARVACCGIVAPVVTSDSFVQTQGAEPAALSTAVRWHDTTAVVTVVGEVDMLTAPQLDEVLAEVLDRQPAKLVVDLTEVGFFASAGLSALVAAYQQAGGNTALRVVATNSATVRPLQITALDRKIPVLPSVDEAVSGG